MQLRGICALVTGGASGLGEATVRSLVAAGGRAAIVDVVEHRGQQLASELGDRATFVPADVSSSPDAEAAVAAVVERFGALQLVVNCAGIAVAARVVGNKGVMALEQFARVIAVNLVGTFNVVRLAAAKMMAQPPSEHGERGIIVNTASIAAFDGQIGQAAAAASKGGIVSMTLPLAREFASKGIRVVTIAPGVFDTPMLAEVPETARQSLAEQVPFPPRLGMPGEFAALVMHIVQNTMLNGEVIRLDGALRTGPR